MLVLYAGTKNWQPDGSWKHSLDRTSLSSRKIADTLKCFCLLNRVWRSLWAVPMTVKKVDTTRCQLLFTFTGILRYENRYEKESNSLYAIYKRTEETAGRQRKKNHYQNCLAMQSTEYWGLIEFLAIERRKQAGAIVFLIKSQVGRSFDQQYSTIYSAHVMRCSVEALNVLLNCGMIGCHQGETHINEKRNKLTKPENILPQKITEGRYKWKFHHVQKSGQDFLFHLHDLACPR